MAKIRAISAREILDSRGNPTIEATVWLDSGHTGLASVPSGASLGKTEAVELRDGDLSRFNGLGVLKAVANINELIGPKIKGLEASYQTKLDQLLIDLDGTPSKRNLGGNTILAVSTAVLKASAASFNLPVYQYLVKKYTLIKKVSQIPTSTFNIINGGKHGAGNLDFQEFHLIPVTNKSYSDALRTGEEIYQKLGEVLTYRGAIHSVGVEGGYAPNLFTNSDALELIVEATMQGGYQSARDVFYGFDVAATTFCKGGMHTIKDQAGSI